MRILQVADAVRYRTMTTNELRESFLVSDLFSPGEIAATYVDADRAVIGSAVPMDEPLKLPSYDALRADYFCERRELGVLNIGGAGAVTVDGSRIELGSRDSLYIGRGSREIVFESVAAARPAQFYFLSYPAHAAYPTARIVRESAAQVEIGDAATANRRRITKLIHLEGVRSSQLVMGFTELATGSVWNTMPAHTHMRRSEVYLYFDLDDAQRVIHLMGLPQETRHLVVANKQVVIAPGWSVHSGVGTSSYAFCWGMGGENQVYQDMDPVAIAELL
jgi:4-deoxy-L-threo-5-hexosulose-uronate ketol-isomerase